MKKIKIFIFFIILFFLISKELSFSKENAVIYLKKSVLISNSCIYLKDIVERIENCSGIDIEKITNLYVAKAPLPKHKTIISREFIKLLLRRNGIDDIQVVGDQTIAVSSYQYLKIENVLNTIKSYIIKEYKSESIDVTLYPITEERLSNLVLPQGEIKLHIDGARNKPGDDLGLVFLPLLIYINDEFYTKMNIGVILEYTTRIITAACDIPAGNIISEEDIQLKEYKITNKREDYIYKIEDIIGRKLKLKKNKGEPILYSDLKQEYLIEVSEPVKLIVKDKNLTIEVEGRACSSAKLHEKIKVKNISSGKIVEGIVIDKGVVQINF